MAEGFFDEQDARIRGVIVTILMKFNQNFTYRRVVRKAGDWRFTDLISYLSCLITR